MSGALLGAIGASAAFVPVIHVYNSTSVNTETIPVGATTVTIELWGGGPVGGGAGTSSGGGGSGAGGYCRTVQTVSSQAGKTYTATISSGGGQCTIVAGTVTGFSTMTGNQGGAGTAGSGGTPGNGGAGGTASGGTVVNTTGGSGANGVTTGGGNGGTPVSGVIPGDGGSHGAGGNGGSAPSPPPTGPFAGAAVFSYV